MKKKPAKNHQLIVRTNISSSALFLSGFLQRLLTCIQRVARKPCAKKKKKKKKGVQTETVLSGLPVPIRSVISPTALVIHHLPQEATRANPQANSQMKERPSDEITPFSLFSVILFPLTGERTSSNQLLRRTVGVLIADRGNSVESAFSV